MSVSNHPSYGRIRRGPMAADAFTQIRNALFRDPRISFKAKGVFGLISTHRDGYGVTPESLAASSKDGVSAVHSALRELEAHGYLVRKRERRPNGTLGPSMYYITDQPEDLQEQQTRRSEPDSDYPHQAEPHQAEPDVADHPHKKTNSKKTSSKKTLSPPSPEPRSAATPAAPERETVAPPTTTAERVIRTAAVVTADEEQAFIAWVTARHTPRGPGWWHAVATNGDLPDLVAAWQAERAPQARTGPALPAWCGQCGDGGTAAAFNPRFRRSDGQPCPDCHPDRHAA